MRDVCTRPYRAAFPLAVALGLAACAKPPAFLTIDVTVNGLSAAGLTLQETLGNKDLAIEADSKTAEIRVPKATNTDPREVGSAYSLFEWNLVIKSQPAGLVCELDGAITGRIIVDPDYLINRKLTVTCGSAAASSRYSLGGTVNGLTASGLVLANGASG